MTPERTPGKDTGIRQLLSPGLSGRLGLIALLLSPLSLSTSAQDDPLVYTGGFHLPLQVQTRQGQTLEKGKYDLEVRLGKQVWLRFLQGAREMARVEGSLLKGAQQEQPGTIPLVGTVFLQSSAVPVGSDAERRYSRTGRPQYVEESYDWRGTLRVYRSLDPQKGEVDFVFHERGPEERHTRIRFTLSSAPSSRPARIRQDPS